MQSKQKYHAYAVATQTVAKTKQIVMLYDGAIRFLQQARDALEQKRIEERYNLLVKASAIMNGLQACLDFEKGGNVAKVLYNFYVDVGGRIFAIHRTQSTKALDEVVGDIKRMRDVWHEIDQGNADPEALAKEPPRVAAPAGAAGSASSDDNVTLSA